MLTTIHLNCSHGNSIIANKCLHTTVVMLECVFRVRQLTLVYRCKPSCQTADSDQEIKWPPLLHDLKLARMYKHTHTHTDTLMFDASHM